MVYHHAIRCSATECMDQNYQRASAGDDVTGRQVRARPQIKGDPTLGRRKQAWDEKQIRRTNRSEAVIAFIECLKVPSGVGAGQPFKLREWQKDFLRDVYDPIDEYGEMQVSDAVFSVARKNGKTALIAGIVLAHLVGPEAITNNEIYSAANDRDQAAQVYKFAAQIVRADEELSKILKCVDSTKTITSQGMGSFYRALSAEAGTKHGFNPGVVVYDELAQARNRELYDVLSTSQGVREDPLFIAISTQSNDPEHMLSKMIDAGLEHGDPATVVHLYEVPLDVEDVFDPEVWLLANPALGDFRKLKDFKKKARQAQLLPSSEPAFRNLYLNQRVSPHSSLITRRDWQACAGEAQLVPGEGIYLGLDLSSTTDLTALVAVSAEDKDRVLSWAWKPEDLLDEHEKRDQVPYQEWVKQGYLLTTPGKTVKKPYIAKHIAELTQEYEVLGVAYDRWRIDDLLNDFDRIGFDAQQGEGSGLRLEPWGQGYRDMGPAIDALEISVMDRDLRHPMNPVLTWNMANALAITDPSGNRKLDKDKARFRIDIAVALAMALGLKSRDRAEGEGEVTEGILII